MWRVSLLSAMSGIRDSLVGVIDGGPAAIIRTMAGELFFCARRVTPARMSGNRPALHALTHAPWCGK